LSPGEFFEKFQEKCLKELGVEGTVDFIRESCEEIKCWDEKTYNEVCGFINKDLCIHYTVEVYNEMTKDWPILELAEQVISEDIDFICDRLENDMKLEDAKQILKEIEKFDEDDIPGMTDEVMDLISLCTKKGARLDLDFLWSHGLYLIIIPRGRYYGEIFDQKLPGDLIKIHDSIMERDYWDPEEDNLDILSTIRKQMVESYKDLVLTKEMNEIKQRIILLSNILVKLHRGDSIVLSEMVKFEKLLLPINRMLLWPEIPYDTEKYSGKKKLIATLINKMKAPLKIYKLRKNVLCFIFVMGKKTVGGGFRRFFAKKLHDELLKDFITK
jgi:hypothetical protein